MKPEELGQYYESILDKEVRKEGSIYYTPSYIVDYIVANTVCELLNDKTPEEAANIRIVDPAFCYRNIDNYRCQTKADIKKQNSCEQSRPCSLVFHQTIIISGKP